MDYAVTVKVRNARILRLMAEAGYRTQAELARAAGVNVSQLCAVVNLREKPTTQNGEWRGLVENVAAALKCDVDDMFSEKQRNMELPANSVTVEMSEPQIIALMDDSGERETWARLETERLLTHLTEREQKVVRLRMEGATMAEAGEELGTSGTRVAQLEAKAFRKMRYAAKRFERAAYWAILESENR